MVFARKGKLPKEDAAKKESRRRRLETALQEGLEETFPASDAVAVTEPAVTLPDDSAIKRSRKDVG